MNRLTETVMMIFSLMMVVDTAVCPLISIKNCTATKPDFVADDDKYAKFILFTAFVLYSKRSMWFALVQSLRLISG